MDDMTPTDKLRTLLDERGVEWEDDSPVPSMKPWKTSFTSFTGEEVTIGCYDEPKWIMGTMVFHTPEQAIAATVDVGTCRNVPERTATIVKVPHKDYISIGHYECGLCGASITPVMRYCHGCGAKLEGASE